MLLDLKKNIADWVKKECGFELLPEKICLLPRSADISFCTGPDWDASGIAVQLEKSRDRFCIKDGIGDVRSEGIWILINLGNGFYREIIFGYAKASEKEAVLNSYVLQRMRMLSRYESCGCPEVPKVRRALFLALIAKETGKRKEEAERALLEMAADERPAERQRLLRQCGDVARAALELLKEG